MVAGFAYAHTNATLTGLTVRDQGVVTAVDANSVTVHWPAGQAAVPLAVPPPVVGTPIAVAYDPTDPTRAVVPGAAVLSDMDRAVGGLVFAGLVGLVVLVTGLWLWWTRFRLVSAPPVEVEVRRFRVQRGLITRSWLELSAHEWVPVYFDPLLVTVPSPTRVEIRRRGRLVAVTYDGVTVHASGRARGTEPRGHRIDNPTEPDDNAHVRAYRMGVGRQLRVDAAVLVAAPMVGLFWAYVDSSGFAGFLGATVVSAAVSLWLWAVRGSDPS
ncbi:hypothetical protein GCM10029964_038960 [Kibdelosporangium lantanae]